MRTSLKIEDDCGYVGNQDALARRNGALALLIMTVSTITIKAALGITSLTKLQEDDGRLKDFLWSNAILFRQMNQGDRTSFHILEVGEHFVLRVNVTKDKLPTYCIELMFGLKNNLGDRHFKGWLEK